MSRILPITTACSQPAAETAPQSPPAFGPRIYGRDEVAGNLSIIHATTCAVTTALSADTAKLYVITGRGKMIFVIDTATNQTGASFEVSQRPWGVVVLDH